MLKEEITAEILPEEEQVLIVAEEEKSALVGLAFQRFKTGLLDFSFFIVPILLLMIILAVIVFIIRNRKVRNISKSRKK